MVSDQELEQSAAQLSQLRIDNERHHTTLSEVLEKYSTLMLDHKRLRSDLEEERDSREKYKQLAKGQDRNPFVLVLVDGDGYVFDDDLIRNGADGGSRAAHLLDDAVRNSLRGRGLDHCRVMVRVYANVAGLSKALSKAKLAGPEKRSIAPFIASFNRSNELFDFVDAGDLKENADFKIRAMFRQFAENAQCKQIYFAACHDVGYISELAPYVNERDRITLIRTSAFHREFSKLGLRAEDFHTVFRTIPLDTQVGISPSKPVSQQYTAPTTDTMQICSFYQKGMCKYGTGCKFQHVKIAATNGIGNTAQPSLSDFKNWRQGSGEHISGPLNVPQSPNNDHGFMTGPSGSREDRTQLQIDFAVKLPSTANPAGQIPVNNSSHRLDFYMPQIASVDKSEFNARIARKKLCNHFHINGTCSNGDACSYDHSPASPAILNCLKQVVYNNPCPRRGACRSSTCLYGHICQKVDCKYRGGHVYCKFPPQTHFQDLMLAGYEQGSNQTPSYNNFGRLDEDAGSGQGSSGPLASSPPLSTSEPEGEGQEEGEGALLDLKDDASVD